MERFAGRRRLVNRRGVAISSYTAMLYLGCTLGIFAGGAAAGSLGLDPSRFVVAATLLLVPALAGARLLYVAEHWGAYRDEPRRVWRRADGGGALYGGLLLAFAVSAPLLPALEIPFRSFWDAASFTMLVGLAVTRLGCLMNGCCGGRPTSGMFGVSLPDHEGVWERRFPTQLLEAGWALVVLVGAATALAHAPFPGSILLGVLSAYAAGRLFLEPARDPSPGLWLNVVISALLLVGSSLLIVAGGAG
jgi:phosphatidylglycerol---prolipoprotein diacylglyceryl transferase